MRNRTPTSRVQNWHATIIITRALTKSKLEQTSHLWVSNFEAMFTMLPTGVTPVHIHIGFLLVEPVLKDTHRAFTMSQVSASCHDLVPVCGAFHLVLPHGYDPCPAPYQSAMLPLSLQEQKKRVYLGVRAPCRIAERESNSRFTLSGRVLSTRRPTHLFVSIRPHARTLGLLGAARRNRTSMSDVPSQHINHCYDGSILFWCALPGSNQDLVCYEQTALPLS